jgi:hypothetical protein
MATDLQRARDDLLVFSVVAGCPLTVKQAGALRLPRRTSVVVAPRQTGKSRSLAVVALWQAFRRRDQTVLIVSSGEVGAKRLLADVTRVARGSSMLAGSVVDDSRSLLTLSNGSTVRSVPASEHQVRGWSVDLLLVDEAALVEDDLLLGAAFPTTAARPHARIVLAGTPAGPEGAFYLFAELGDQGSQDVRTFRWSLADASWIEGSVVDAARAALAPAQFDREFEARFADVGAEERVIPREWVQAAVERRGVDTQGPAVVGVDVARHGGDESVAVRVCGGVVSLLFAMREPDLMATTGKIASLSGEGALWLDVTGLGFGVADRLAEQRLAVTHFVAGARSSDSRRWLNLRSQAWWHARGVFEAGEVALPDDPVLAGQLSAVRYGLASNGAIQIQAKDSMRVSPDRADALVIALWGARQAAGWAAWQRKDRYVPRHPLAEGAESLSYDAGDLTGDLLARDF